MPTRPSALLLSGSIGMGHDALAIACSGALRSQGFQTRTLDAMKLLGRGGGSAGEAVFRAMLAAPGLYDAFYYAALRTGGRLARATDAIARRRLEPALVRQLDAEPADLIVSVFATGASAVSAITRRYAAMKHVVFCTDTVPHRLWVHPHVDLYLVTAPVAEQAVLRFQPDARVQVVPQPVRPAFYSAPTQAAARITFGVPATERCVLMMSGAWGLGPLAAAGESLARAGVHVLAVAGRNARLYRELVRAAARQPRLRAFGFSDRIPELMAASDLVITSSGDTCTEARVVGRPLLLLDVVAGHGRDNLQHELELGEAAVCSARPAEVTRCALAALDRAKPAPAGGPRDEAAACGANGHAVPGWQPAFLAALASVGV